MNPSRTEHTQGPTRLASRLKLASVALVLMTLGLAAQAQDGRLPELPSPLCDKLHVPEDSIMVFHAYGLGVQIYQWNGTTWAFVAPQATLYADAGYHGQIGTHFAGPTWASNSGSQVVAAKVEACNPDPNSIAWLKLASTSTQGPGLFDGVTFVQRLNTVGGLAPTTPGNSVGEMVAIPYTADYFFYTSPN